MNTLKIVKCGFDPTTTDLHLGHTVVLKTLKGLQDEGHLIKIIFGTFTATVGDPTGKDKTRPVLDFNTVFNNCKTYKEQIFKILDPTRVSFYYNHEWLSNFTLSSLLDIFNKITVAQLLSRNNFSERMSNFQPISLSEITYPILQGYDSLYLKSNIEVGGTDQLFNMMMGRNIQSLYNQEPQEVITVPLLLGTDGINKMSKSLGNHISLNDLPSVVYNKILCIPDSLIQHYYDLLSFTALVENPKQAKQNLAIELIKRFHGIDYDPNTDVVEYTLEYSDNLYIISVLNSLNITSNSSIAKNLISSKAVLVNETTVESLFKFSKGRYLVTVSKHKRYLINIV